MSTVHPPTRLAVLFDYPQEGWISMDLCAAMLLEGLQQAHGERYGAQGVVPPYHRRFQLLSARGRNVDRLLNRLWDYPRHMRRIRGQFDLFHIADHSYSQLVHALPPHRSGVYCHDLDTFACLLRPELEPRPKWFGAMTRRILRGMQKAAVVFHSTRLMREQIIQHGLIDPARLVLAPLGVAPEYTPSADAGDLPQFAAGNGPFILHVGSAVARKRLDVLLNVFAAVHRSFPDLRLVQIGGSWTSQHRQIIEAHNLQPFIVQRGSLNRIQLAGLYRRAAVVLQPSEAEGFGLPVIEALACGAAVLASDLPILREVAGPAACYAPVGDVQAWAGLLNRLLSDPNAAPAPALRAAQASQYTWANHCRIIADAYQRLLA